MSDEKIMIQVRVHITKTQTQQTGDVILAMTLGLAAEPHCPHDGPCSLSLPHMAAARVSHNVRLSVPPLRAPCPRFMSMVCHPRWRPFRWLASSVFLVILIFYFAKGGHRYRKQPHVLRPDLYRWSTIGPSQHLLLPDKIDGYCKAHGFKEFKAGLRPRKIYDLFLFSYELDWLEIRLRALEAGICLMLNADIDIQIHSRHSLTSSLLSNRGRPLRATRSLPTWPTIGIDSLLSTARLSIE